MIYITAIKKVFKLFIYQRLSSAMHSKNLEPNNQFLAQIFVQNLPI